MKHIPFNRPFVIGKEFKYIQEAITLGHLSGNGRFTKKCQTWLEQQIGCRQALLTHSCTAALEMTALLADIQPGDEIIMPSYTFVSTANAFVLRGGVPVFIDVRPDTFNLDENQIEPAITDKTKAIVVVHYAGVGCEMDTIMAIAKRYNLIVIEDAAQGMMATYKGHSLGGIGHLAATSFHETKNVISGEGGALLLNGTNWTEQAEIIWEKGTNRTKFFRGEVDKYTWVDLGSSYLPSEINAAFLWAQLEEAGRVTRQRLQIWEQYHQSFNELEQREWVRRPVIPSTCRHNGHLYYLLLPNLEYRTAFITGLKAVGINPVFHYVPLHTSPAGKKYGRTRDDLPNTQKAGQCLVRLPLWVGLDEQEINYVVEQVQTQITNLLS